MTRVESGGEKDVRKRYGTEEEEAVSVKNGVMRSSGHQESICRDGRARVM